MSYETLLSSLIVIIILKSPKKFIITIKSDKAIKDYNVIRKKHWLLKLCFLIKGDIKCTKTQILFCQLIGTAVKWERQQQIYTAPQSACFNKKIREVIRTTSYYRARNIYGFHILI